MGFFLQKLRLQARLGFFLRALSCRLQGFLHGSFISFGVDLLLYPGAQFTLGKGVRIVGPGAITVYENAHLEIGDGCNVGRNNTLYCATAILIEPACRLAHNCTLVDHDYDFRAAKDYYDAPKIARAIVLGKGTLLCANVTVLKGVVIGEYCVIGANTLITTNIAPESLAYAERRIKTVHIERKNART